MTATPAQTGKDTQALAQACAQAQDLALACAQALSANDVAAKETMGIELLSCAPGRAAMRMQVREKHLNGHKICHGGFIFTLADTTFAYACNSHNKNAVAAGCSIEFLKPGQLGDVLHCEGVEQTLQGRHGIYDMKVSNQHGDVVAMFRGKSAQIPGSLV